MPAWLIFDDAFGSRYAFSRPSRGHSPGMARPGTKEAESLEALAGLCGIIRGAQARWNGSTRNAAAGDDPDFHRVRTPTTNLGDPSGSRTTASRRLRGAFLRHCDLSE